MKPSTVDRAGANGKAARRMGRPTGLRGRAALMVASSAATLAAVATADAAPDLYTGASSTSFSDGGNWSLASEPGALNDAVFNQTSYAYQPTVATAADPVLGLIFGDGTTATAALTVGNSGSGALSVGNDGVVVYANSGAITITAPLTLSAGGAFVTNNGGNGLTISAVSAGGGGMTFNGSGTTSVGTVTTSGGVTVSGGTLDLTVGINSANAINVATGAVLDVLGSAVANNNTQLGSGGGTVWNISGTIRNDGTNNYLLLPTSVVLNNGTIAGTGTSGRGTLYGGTNSAYGTPTITANGSANAISVASFVMPGNVNFATPLSTDALTISAPISNLSGFTGAVTKLGLGTLTLTASSAYSGQTNVSAGTLVLSGAGSASASAPLILSGALLDVEGTNTSSVIGGSPGLTWNVSGTLSVDGTGNYLTLPYTVLLAGGGTLTGTSSNASNGSLYGGSSGPDYVLGNAPQVIATGAGNTISVPSIVLAGIEYFNAPSGSDALTISSPVNNLSGNTAYIAKAGLGTLTLSSASSTYSGGTTLTAGQIIVGNNGTATAGPLGTGTLTMAAGTTLNSSAGSGQYTLANAIAVTGTVNVFTGLTLSGAISGSTGVLTVGGTGTLTLANGNSYAGGTVVNAGTVVSTAQNGFGSGPITVNAGATIVGAGQSTVGGTYNTTTRTISLLGGTTGTPGGVWNLSAGSLDYVRTLNLSGGSVIHNSPTALYAPQDINGTVSGITVNSLATSISSTISAPIDLYFSGITFNVASGTVPNGQDLVDSGGISQSGVYGVTKLGAGTLVLSAASSYTGGTNVSGGTVISTVTNGFSTGPITVNAGATIVGAGQTTVGGVYNNTTRTISLLGGTTGTPGGVWNLSGGTFDYARTLNLSGGSVISSSPTALFAPADVSGTVSGITVNSLATSISSTISAPIDLYFSGITLNVASGTVPNGQDLVDTGGISQNGTYGVTKLGTGKLVFGASSSYSGGTNVSGGTLVANSAQSTGTGTVTVYAGGTLAGTGKAGYGSSGVVVLSGGNISGGSGATSTDSIGNLSTGAQTWGSGAYVAKFAADNSSNDRLILSGLTATPTAGFVIDLQGAAAASIPAGTYVLAVDTGATGDPFGTTANPANLTLEVNGSTLAVPAGYSLSDASGDSTGLGGTDLRLVVAAPEPGSGVLLGIAAASLLGRRSGSRRAARPAVGASPVG
jgi:fibronectin-binding autotransporter adhesin